MIGSEAPFDTDQLLLPTADIFYNHFLYLTVKHGGCGRPPENEVTRPRAAAAFSRPTRSLQRDSGPGHLDAGSM